VACLPAKGWPGGVRAASRPCRDAVIPGVARLRASESIATQAWPREGGATPASERKALQGYMGPGSRTEGARPG